MRKEAQENPSEEGTALRIRTMDRNEALDFLRGREEGITEWNRRRRSRKDIANLRAAFLQDGNLSAADLSSDAEGYSEPGTDRR